MSEAPAIVVHDLSIAAPGGMGDILDGISFEVTKGEVLAVVGESGSGKSTLGLAMLGHTRPGLRVSGGHIDVAGQRMTEQPPQVVSRVRGSVVAYVPQDASVSINPSRRLGRLLDELLGVHQPTLTTPERHDRIVRSLESAHLPHDDEFLRRFVHQLSGGQQQRLGIAMALAGDPEILILDEPTTGLDAITQQGILAAVTEACQLRGVTAVFITHDLEVVKSIADRVLVLYAGRIAELGPRAQLVSEAAHPYTRGLIRSAPSVDKAVVLQGIAGSSPGAADRPSGCAFSPRCPMVSGVCKTDTPPLREMHTSHHVACHHAQGGVISPLEPRLSATTDSQRTSVLATTGLTVGYGSRTVLHEIDLSISHGSCLGLVGASGSGKTTFSRALVGLVEPRAGSVSLDGVELAASVDDRTDEQRRALQYVFQNPYSSLNPRKSILEILEQPARAFDVEFSRAVASSWLERVLLSPRSLDRRPDALSGGERQRVAIARALACEPRYLVCDEITAPLDVSVQAGIVELIRSIAADAAVGVLFVTHDLGVVRSLTDHVAIFEDGRCVEHGATSDVIDEPSTAYGRELVWAATSGTAAAPVERDGDSKTNRPLEPQERPKAHGTCTAR